MCRTCGVLPRTIENGYEHPYCRRSCVPRVTGITHRPRDFLPHRSRHGSLHNAQANPVMAPRRVRSAGGSPRHRILFYHRHDPHYGFTNFSPHPIQFKGKTYPTSEHLFQSFKFLKHKPWIAEHMRTCSNFPRDVFAEARRHERDIRFDWKRVKIKKMNIALWHKFTQHRDLKNELLATGDAELIEDSDQDAFWGVGRNGNGRNELGKALERLRTKLRTTNTL